MQKWATNHRIKQRSMHVKGPYINDVSRVRGEGGSQFLTKGREVA